MKELDFTDDDDDDADDIIKYNWNVFGNTLLLKIIKI